MNRFQFSWQQVAIITLVIVAVSYFALSGNGDKLETVGMGVVALLALVARSPFASAPAPAPEVKPDEAPTKKDGKTIPPLPVLLVLLVVAMLSGCNGAKAPTARDSSRAAVELLATALPLANELCSKSNDRAVLERCAKAYDVGRPSLIAAAQVIDAWAGASENDRACVLSSSLKALASIVDAMKAGGLAVPDLVRDGLSFAGALVGSCREVSP